MSIAAVGHKDVVDTDLAASTIAEVRFVSSTKG